MRRFYLAYSKYEAPSRIFGNNENSLDSIQQAPTTESYNFKLNWSHCLILRLIVLSGAGLMILTKIEKCVILSIALKGCNIETQGKALCFKNNQTTKSPERA